MSDRQLELDDIQGNILGGFNTDIQVLLFFSVAAGQISNAAAWVATLAEEVTTASEVSARRDLIKTDIGPNAPTWLFVAVSLGMLQGTAKDLSFNDIAFNTGHLNRAKSVLNDRTNPMTWVAGNVAKPVDVLLLIGGNVDAAVAGRTDQLLKQATAAGLTLAWRENAQRLEGEREHFGFRDGISQPLVTGYDPGDGMAAGNFVFGYPKTTGGAPVKPSLDPRGVADNGSLLVWRRLNQNVQAFRDFCAAAAAQFSTDWPGLSKEHMAALLVGRWPSGAPVLAGQFADPNPTTTENDFNFSGDSNGQSCPFGAHIRKVNPRKGKADVVDVPRLLRRGIPHGKPYDQAPGETDRGLTFLAFQTSIKEQFEFLTQHWMNSDLNPAQESDLLIGRRSSPGNLNIWGPAGPINVTGPADSWITPCGGAYLFAPSRSGLRKLAEPPAPAIQWRAQKFLLQLTSSFRELF
ncbi:Dyp-type peroxidase [Pseudomonas lini]|uniref:Dyp-type peroxidase n=1 Tax=Pseudomonas lini TaxID=163011 RepID=UPI00345E52C5